MNWEQSKDELSSLNKEFDKFNISVGSKKRKDWTKEDEANWEEIHRRCIALHYERIRINMEKR